MTSAAFNPLCGRALGSLSIMTPTAASDVGGIAIAEGDGDRGGVAVLASVAVSAGGVMAVVAVATAFSVGAISVGLGAAVGGTGDGAAIGGSAGEGAQAVVLTRRQMAKTNDPRRLPHPAPLPLTPSQIGRADV